MELQASASTGEIVIIPPDSPLRWLPKLVGIIVGTKFPLGFIIDLVTQFLKEIILEQIRRKLKEKKATFYQGADIAVTSIIEIPNDAKAIVLKFNNIPSWIGKRLQPNDLNTGVIIPSPTDVPDLAKYLIAAFGSIIFGYQVKDSDVTKSVFWQSDIKLDYKHQIVSIPNYEEVTNINRYAYIYLENEITCSYEFMKIESASLV